MLKLITLVEKNNNNNKKHTHTLLPELVYNLQLFLIWCWCPLSVSYQLLPQLDVRLAVVLDVDVGFSSPVGVLGHFVQGNVVKQEVDVDVRTSDTDDGVAGL